MDLNVKSCFGPGGRAYTYSQVPKKNRTLNTTPLKDKIDYKNRLKQEH
jgi:hypothetical protein